MNSPRDHKDHLHGAVIDFTEISCLTCIYLRLDPDRDNPEEWFPGAPFGPGKIRGQGPVIPIPGS